MFQVYQPKATPHTTQVPTDALRRIAAVALGRVCTLSIPADIELCERLKEEQANG